MGKRRWVGVQEAAAEGMMPSCCTLLHSIPCIYGTQFIHSKESEGCECDMVSLMKAEYLKKKKKYLL